MQHKEETDAGETGQETQELNNTGASRRRRVVSAPPTRPKTAFPNLPIPSPVYKRLYQATVEGKLPRRPPFENVPHGRPTLLNPRPFIPYISTPPEVTITPCEGRPDRKRPAPSHHQFVPPFPQATQHDRLTYQLQPNTPRPYVQPQPIPYPEPYDRELMRIIGAPKRNTGTFPLDHNELSLIVTFINAGVHVLPIVHRLPEPVRSLLIHHHYQMCDLYLAVHQNNELWKEELMTAANFQE